MLRDFELMTEVLNNFDDNTGFVETSNDKKKKLKMYLKREPGKRMFAIKFEVEKIAIPIYNLITLIYEVDLYPEWFPNCSKASTVRLKIKFLRYNIENRLNVLIDQRK
jgi:hypothetical protein